MRRYSVVAPKINVEVRFKAVCAVDEGGVARLRLPKATTSNRVEVVFGLRSKNAVGLSSAESKNSWCSVRRACQDNRVEGRCMSDI